MRLNLEFDANAQAAPQFRDAIQQAANIIDATFTDAITVNIAVGYGELTANGATETLQHGAAESTTTRSASYSYASIHSLLEQSLSTDVVSGALVLPAGALIQGSRSVTVWGAEQKALGLLSADDSGLDGAAGFAADIPANLLVGVAMHELTHAMGRLPDVGGSTPDVFDLYRYQSAGTHLFGDAIPSPSAYFSLDGGLTDLADYGIHSDPSDLLNSSGRTPNDPFNEFYNSATLQTLTPVDILQMEALGFHAAASTAPTTSHSTPSQTAPPATSQTAPPAAAEPHMIWQTASGVAAAWEVDGGAFVTATTLPSVAGWQIQDAGDFNGDGVKADLVLRNTATGMVDVWQDNAGVMSGHDVASATLDWQIMGTADFNGDGKSDILWRNEQNGYVSVWQMNGSSVATTYNPGVVGLQWHVIGAGDYVGDGKAEVLWRDSGTGEVNLWTIDGPGAGQTHGQTVAFMPLEWTAVGQGDFNGDGRQDVLWHDNATGQVAIWELNGPQVIGTANVANLGPQWTVADIVDANGDGKADIVWRDSGTGQVVLWDMNGFNVSHASALGTVDSNWQAINHHYDWV